MRCRLKRNPSTSNVSCRLADDSHAFSSVLSVNLLTVKILPELKSFLTLYAAVGVGKP